MKKAIILKKDFIEDSVDGQIIEDSHTVIFQVIEDNKLLYKGDVSVKVSDLSYKDEYDVNIKLKVRDACKDAGYDISLFDIIIL